MNNEQNIILEKSFDFAVRIVELYKHLIQEKKEYVLSKQILRSGTSIGANIEEAMGGISKADFSAKLSIAYKETRETSYWLRILHKTKFITEKEFQSLFIDKEELAKILFTIIKSSRK